VKFADAAPLVAASGEGRLLSLVDETTGQPISDEVKGSITWGTTGGIGFVNQGGWFLPVRLGSGAVVVLIGDRRAELPVTVVAGKPAKLAAKIVPDPSGAPNLAQVEVKLTDVNGNAIPGVAVTISITGGTADCASKTTDEKGAASFNVTWDATSAEAKVTVSAAGLTAQAE
jgi:hypothetical protein